MDPKTSAVTGRAYCLIDQVCSFVNGAENNAVRQCLVNDLDFFLNGVDNIGGVLSHSRQRHTEYDLLAVSRHRAETQCRALFDGRYISQINGRPVRN